MSNQRTSVWLERLSSPLTWHYVGSALLLAVTIALAIRLGLDWAAIDSRASDALTGRQIELKALDLQIVPLRGLDQRIAKSRAAMQTFFQKRIPPNYSSISNRVNELAVASGVRLTRVQYTQGAPGIDLTEISMDAAVTGEYPAIMHFVNSLERDPVFFVIRTMNLTSQQGGQVSLRMRVSTWLRPADAEASGLPATPSADQAAAPAPSKEGE
jgi:type IV pilus assembly protein PilO